MDIKLMRKKLKENRMTYEDLSRETGVSLSTIKAIFSYARPNPHIKTLQALEKALGLDEDRLIDGYNYYNKILEKLDLDKSRIEKLSPRDIEIIRIIIDAFINTKN